MTGDPPPMTVRCCIDTCTRGKDLALLLGGGGLAGLVILGAGDLASYVFSNAPGVLLPAFVVLVLMTAYTIGMSYSTFERQVTRLQRQLDDGSVRPDSTVSDIRRQRNGALLRRLSLLLLLITALVFVVACFHVWLTPR